MRLRWPKYLPRFPAVLLVPAVLGGWILQCFVPWELTGGDIGFPRVFMLEEWQDSISEWGYEFYIGPFLLDLTLALAAAYSIAMVVELSGRIRTRVALTERPGLSEHSAAKRDAAFRWSKVLPGFSAVLVMPLVLGLWARLCVTHSEYDWSSFVGHNLYWPEYVQGEPWNNPRGYPFRYSGSWEPMEGGGYFWPGLQVHWFLLDLIIALAVAYVVAMAVDRLVLPLIRRQSTKKFG
ncbi:MAG: hypothetical protein O7H41_18310 [Planctomycetota bacterium]|nr:hypothetical protein [Planctomycetota bacterium]